MAPASRPTGKVWMLLLWFTGAMASALFAGIVLYLAPLEPGALALQFAFSPRAFGQVVHLWPAEHLARYRAHFPADFALLACYGCFGWLLATRTRWLTGRTALLRIWATWALPVAALGDATENAFHLWLTAVPRFGVPWAYVASASAASLKWILLVSYGIAILHALHQPRR